MADQPSSSVATRSKNDNPRPTKRPLQHPHPFWKDQPVVQGPGSTTLKDKHIKSPNSLTKFLIDSDHELPELFECISIDVNIDRCFSKLDVFISRYYLKDEDEDDNCVMNFSYTRDFLRWVLRAPGSIRSLHVAICHKKTKKLAGFIAGTPATIRIKTEIRRVAIANLLCVHKLRRSERLAPFLINELARRATAEEIWQGIYATEARVPTPLCSCEWLQRILNPKKLGKLGYAIKLNRKRKRNNVEIQNLPPEPETIGFRKMKRRDVSAVAHLLKEHLKTFTVAPVVDDHFVEHFLVPKHGVVDTYVVEDPETLVITDFCSFVTQRREFEKKHKWWTVKCAVLFYYAASKTNLLNLIRDLVVMACRDEFDIFRAQGIMGNDLFLDKLMFEAMPKKKLLHYHLYNYGLMNVVMPKELGLVIL